MSVSERFQYCKRGQTHELPDPLAIEMQNGYTLRIDTVAIYEHRALMRQLASGKCEIKFCVDNDEDIDSLGETEQYRIVFFPFLDEDGDEIPHGVIADRDESIVNGNIKISGGEITDYSTNHWDRDYARERDIIIEYAKNYVQAHLDAHR